MVFYSRLIAISLLLFSATLIGAQNINQLSAEERVVLQLELSAGDVWSSEAFSGSLGPHISYFIKSAESIDGLEWRQEGANWTAVPVETHFRDPDFHYSQLAYLQPKHSFQIRSATSIRFELHFYQPGFTGSSQPSIQNRSIDCSCPSPAIVQRDQWCANCGEDPSPVFTDPTHFIVHHSAGSNTSSDWPAVVRSIWDFHVNGRGWDDVGYNYLIDPEGVIYNGRGEGLMGAHFCGTNSGTLGVCVLGTYSGVAPTEPSVQGIQDLAAWQLCKWQTNPTTVSLHASSNRNLIHISGHRDGCATECPGQQLYDQLSTIRISTLEKMLNCDEDSNSLDPMILKARALSDFHVALDYEQIPFAEAQITLVERINFEFGTTENERSLNEEESLEVFLFPERNYAYQLRADYPDGRQRFSNVVTLAAPALPFGKKPIQVQPNPVGQDLRLVFVNDWRGDVDIRIFNVSGKSVLERQFRKESVEFRTSFDISHFPAGLYYVRLQQADQEELIPVVKAE